MSTDGRHESLKSGWQEHDIWYVVDRVRDVYWQESWHLIQQVVAHCKGEVKPVAGREALLAAAKEKMSSIVEARGGEAKAE